MSPTHESNAPDPSAAVSGASLGLGVAVGEGCGPVPSTLAIPEPERYQVGGLIGRGGMGSIRAAYDQRLGRSVAVKTSTARGGEAQRQLVAEAQLTASLVHPGIVPVHDAGNLPDGRPYYTMPIVDGRSLAEAIAHTTPARRLRLVRPFLHACEAVGYAHAEGVLHRDLKPANILVGRFGETVVVDWGLAGPVGIASPRAVGTEAYMAPEQRAGRPLSAAADVFSLGVTLREILCGATDRPPPADTPPELLAIAARATRFGPSHRYLDARALARDVEAWFEGRRVSAHRYTARDVVARTWASHRLAVCAALLAVLGITTATVAGVWRVSWQRALAIDSERRAVAARHRAERNLANAEIAQAIVAVDRGAWAEAEILASDALTHGPSAVARGVLARFDRNARPRRVATHTLASCGRAVISADGQQRACANDGFISVAAIEGPSVTPRRVPTRGDPQAFTTDGSVVVDSAVIGLVVEPPGSDRFVLEHVGARRVQPHGNAGPMLSWSRGAFESWASLGDRDVQRTQVCRTRGQSVPAATAVRADGLRVVLCQDGSVFTAGRGEFLPSLRLPSAWGAPVAISFARSGGRLAAVATAVGGAAIVDLVRGQVVRRFATAGTPLDLALSDRRLALSDSRGAVHVWDLDTGLLAVRLSATRAAVRWIQDGRRLRVVTATSADDWEIPIAARPHVIETDAGIAALSLSPDGREALTAHGDGVVRHWQLRAGTLAGEFPLHWSVVKDVEFSADGDRAVAACAQDERVHHLDLRGGEVTSVAALPGLRVAWLGTQHTVVAPYAGGLQAWHGGTPSPRPWSPSDGRVSDLETDHDRRRLTALTRDGRVLRLDDRRAPAVRARLVLPGAVAVAGSEQRIAVIDATSINVFGSDGTRLATTPTDATATDVALSADARRIAVGHLDGRITVWSHDLRHLATLHGHSGRVSALAFAGQGALVSGGWDGDIRQWALEGLDTDAERLLAVAERSWGRTVDEILSTEGQLSAPHRAPL